MLQGERLKVVVDGLPEVLLQPVAAQHTTPGLQASHLEKTTLLIAPITSTTLLERDDALEAIDSQAFNSLNSH